MTYKNTNIEVRVRLYWKFVIFYFCIMPQNNFRFKQFTVSHDKCAFKVGTDGVLLGAAVEVPASGYILDIGTGSGLIALMLAQRSEAEIIALEPDKDSIEQAA